MKYLNIWRGIRAAVLALEGFGSLHNLFTIKLKPVSVLPVLDWVYHRKHHLRKI
jgi:hypothetical protein